ncbi:hypothetical protein BJ508DRAFT_361368 [Ascobolus immersus RN42]|uniref:Uncharacterized protein n=1 Tax=Ascobolus immersus RN42 TaxID=1160509 RepID=A0A3N4IKP4_ASCIM|nr:hypothetical protein BJ508DRAFT_361368 [Ascobolus immersus RN42]
MTGQETSTTTPTSRLSSSSNSGSLREPLFRRLVTNMRTHLRHPEALIEKDPEPTGTVGLIHFKTQQNIPYSSALGDDKAVLSGISALSIQHLLDGKKTASATASACHLGFGISLSVAHPLELGDDELEKKDENPSGVFTVGGIRHIEEVTGPIHFGRLEERRIGSAGSILASMPNSLFPYEQRVEFDEDLALLQLGKIPAYAFLPGELEADMVAKLATVNGDMPFQTYQAIFKKMRNVSVDMLDEEDYIDAKYDICPGEISLAVGTGVLSADRATLYHENSSLAWASGGAVLNSKNQLIAIHLGAGRVPDDFGRKNSAVYLAHPRVKAFLRVHLLPLLPLGSIEHSAWSVFLGAN